MVQVIEFPGFQGDTLDLRVITKGTDTIVHTASGLTGKTNDASFFRATDIPDALSGIHRVSAIDASGQVAFAGWVDLSGVASAEHIAGSGYGELVALRSRPRKNRAFANFAFFMVQSSDSQSPATGLSSFTSQYSLDGDPFAALSGTVTEIGSGWYKLSTFTAAELNGITLAARFAASGADTRNVFFTLSPAS